VVIEEETLAVWVGVMDEVGDIVAVKVIEGVSEIDTVEVSDIVAVGLSVGVCVEDTL